MNILLLLAFLWFSMYHIIKGIVICSGNIIKIKKMHMDLLFMMAFILIVFSDVIRGIPIYMALIVCYIFMAMAVKESYGKQVIFNSSIRSVIDAFNNALALNNIPYLMHDENTYIIYGREITINVKYTAVEINWGKTDKKVLKLISSIMTTELRGNKESALEGKINIIVGLVGLMFVIYPIFFI